MTCKEVVLQFLMDYLARELPPAIEAEFELHIAQCPSCVGYLQSYKDTVALGRGVAAADEEAEVPAELVAAVLSLSRA
jgi:anti-sigma factor RsiW